MEFKNLKKLNKGDKVAIVSPSTVAPAIWPAVYELGLKRVREVFELEPVEMNFTCKKGATREQRGQDLIDAFRNPEIKAVISTLGGDDQVTYIKNLPKMYLHKILNHSLDIVITHISSIIFGCVVFQPSMEELSLPNLRCKFRWMILQLNI